jgi:hypothetical protein
LDAVGVNMPLREARKARHQVSDGGDEVCHVNLLIWKSLWRAGGGGTAFRSLGGGPNIRFPLAASDAS